MPEKKTEEKDEQPPSPVSSMLIFHTYEQEHTTQKCAIATAAYGTPIALELDVLRGWRDEIEKYSRIGRAFTAMYYKISPPIAELVEKSKVAKAIVRTALSPLVKILAERKEI